jgi:hypothetical protein
MAPPAEERRFLMNPLLLLLLLILGPEIPEITAGPEFNPAG